MSITISSLVRSPAKVTLGGVGPFFVRDTSMVKHGPTWVEEKCTLHGKVDKSRRDLVIKHNLLLFGLWQNLTTIFPSYILNPVVGTNIFSDAGNAFVYHARNNDRLTYPQSQITKLANLYLGVDSELFAAAVEITSLLAPGSNPEDANAYFTRDTAAYTETTFAMTNFKKVRFTGAWTGKTGLTSFAPQKGFNIAWTVDLKEDKVDGYGTVNMVMGEGAMTGAAKFIPIGPTAAQVDTAQNIAQANGGLLSANAADLTMSGSGISVGLVQGAMVESSTAFGIEPLRVNEMMIETTRKFTAGVAQAVATVA